MITFIQSIQSAFQSIQSARKKELSRLPSLFFKEELNKNKVFKEQTLIDYNKSR
jgi:hypothetical protein